jgi:hypothetical protein
MASIDPCLRIHSKLPNCVEQAVSLRFGHAAGKIILTLVPLIRQPSKYADSFAKAGSAASRTQDCVPAGCPRPITGRPHHERRCRPGGIIGHDEAVIGGVAHGGIMQ